MRDPASHIPPQIEQRLRQAERSWLFLDYDGTLADFAPTPEQVTPDPELIDLLGSLAKDPRLRVAVISGRRLDQIRELVPLPGILLAGTYGLELQTFQGERRDRLDYHAIRPTLDRLKPQWVGLLARRKGFFLEDKGWTLALHARFAQENESDEVLASAHSTAIQAIQDASPGLFRMLGGHRFLEIAPQLAHKGRTVAYLLDQYPWSGALPLYLGDDDKDEEAFGVVKERGGVALLVSTRPRQTRADGRLESPQAARSWLQTELLPRRRPDRPTQETAPSPL